MTSQLEHLEKVGYGRIRNMVAGEAISESGSRRALDLHPFLNLNEVQAQQRKVSGLRKLIDGGAMLPLEPFEDMRDELKRCRVSGAYFAPEGLLQIANILRLSDDIWQYFRSHRTILEPLEFIVRSLKPLQPLRQALHKIVDEEARIKDGASPQLAHIRQEIQHKITQLHRAVARLMDQARGENWLHEENPTIREGRFVLPLRTEFKRKVHGIIHGQSATGATTYVEPLEIVEINNALKEFEQDEQEEIRLILQRMTESLRPHFEDLEVNSVMLVELDFLNACARFSRKFHCTEPRIAVDGTSITLINARHPLLELVKEVVPLNIALPDKINTVILTGPNAGGKTVAMKSIGLLSAMAMSGLHIPADEGSSLPWFESFLVDIGDQQSIENDLSTFSSHVSNLKEFLAQATSQSLVLIDELGTGTEPIEGSALAEAVLEELIGRGTLTIVTTHHNALKAFAEKRAEVVNAAMEFDTRSLTPTYRLNLGMPGSSYALEIATRLGLPRIVIDRARSIMGGDTVKLESLLLEVESLRSQIEDKNRSVDLNKRTLDKLISEYEEKVKSIREKHAKFDKELAEKLETMVKDSRARIEHAVKDIREKEADPVVVKEARKIVEDLQQEAHSRVRKPKRAPKPAVEELHEGDWVKIDGFPKKGQIVKLTERSSRVGVEMDGKTIWVGRENLSPTKLTHSEANLYQSAYFVHSEHSASPILDLRGKRLDEAESELIRFLDHALLSGLTYLEIIHGKGTGALQKMVWDELRKFKGIKSFRFDHFDRGGTGATIVDM